MNIIPAIDILDGKCVRLYQGDYQQKKQYSQSPVDQVKVFAQSGCKKIHIVDLTAAKNSKNRQTALIEKMVKAADIEIETGGGLRNFADIQNLYNLGVTQVILGTVACTDRALTEKTLAHYPQTILAADLFIDRHEKFIASHGWQTKQNLTLNEFIGWYKDCRYFLCTDISKDGALTGPNFSLYSDLSKQFPSRHWIVSGGISCLDDLIQLKKNGAQSVVIGKALYENRFTLPEALSC